MTCSIVDFGFAFRYRIFFSTLLISFLCSACDRSSEQEPVFTGATMGTTYTIKLGVPVANTVLASLKKETDKILLQVNQQMSTYLPDSELSQFNQTSSTAWFQVSPDTALVIQKSLLISQMTAGAFDITVGPLVNLWGFGPDARRDTPPTPAEIQQRLAQVGYQQLEVKNAAIRKKNANIYADLSAIAKGF